MSPEVSVSYILRKGPRISRSLVLSGVLIKVTAKSYHVFINQKKTFSPKLFKFNFIAGEKSLNFSPKYLKL